MIWQKLKAMTYMRQIHYSKTIDGAFSKAEPAGARHERFFDRERAKLAMEIFIGIGGLEPLGQVPGVGDIIRSYIASGSEGTKNEIRQ